MPDWTGTFQNRARHDCLKQDQHCIDTTQQGFPQAVYTWGIFPPSYGGGTSAGEQSVNGGTHAGDIDLMGGPNFHRLYHKLKVLLMLSCSYTMQFIGYDSIKTH